MGLRRTVRMAFALIPALSASCGDGPTAPVSTPAGGGEVELEAPAPDAGGSDALPTCIKEGQTVYMYLGCYDFSDPCADGGHIVSASGASAVPVVLNGWFNNIEGCIQTTDTIQIRGAKCTDIVMGNTLLLDNWLDWTTHTDSDTTQIQLHPYDYDGYTVPSGNVEMGPNYWLYLDGHYWADTGGQVSEYDGPVVGNAVRLSVHFFPDEDGWQDKCSSYPE